MENMKTLKKHIGLLKFSLFGTNRLVFNEIKDDDDDDSIAEFFEKVDVEVLKSELLKRAEAASYADPIETDNIGEMERHFSLIKTQFDINNGTNGKAPLKRIMEILKILIREKKQADLLETHKNTSPEYPEIAPEDIQKVMDSGLFGDDKEEDDKEEKVDEDESRNLEETKKSGTDISQDDINAFMDSEEEPFQNEDEDEDEFLINQEDIDALAESSAKIETEPSETDSEISGVSSGTQDKIDKTEVLREDNSSDDEPEDWSVVEEKINLEDGEKLIGAISKIMDEIKTKIENLGEMLDEDQDNYEESLEKYKTLMAEIYGLFIKVDETFGEFPKELTQDETKTIANLRTEKAELEEDFNYLLKEAQFTDIVDLLKQINPKMEEKKEAQKKRLKVQPGIKMISLSLKNIEGNLAEAIVATDNLEQSLEKYKDDMVISAVDLLNFHLKLVDEISEIEGELAYLKAKQELGATKIKVSSDKKEVDITGQIELFESQLNVAKEQLSFVENEMNQVGGRVISLISSQENITNIDSPKGKVSWIKSQLAKI